MFHVVIDGPDGKPCVFATGLIAKPFTSIDEAKGFADKYKISQYKIMRFEHGKQIHNWETVFTK